VLLVFALAAVPFFVDLDRYRDRWLPAVESALGRRVEVGRVELTVLTGLGAHVDGLAVHGDPADPEPLLTVESVRLRVRLLPLLHGRVVVARVVLIRPALRFVARAAADVGASPDQPPDSARPNASPFGLAALSLADLTIRDGALSYEDRSGGGVARYELDRIDATLARVAVGETLAVDATGRLAGADLPVSLTATAGPLDATFKPAAFDSALQIGDSRVTLTGTTEAAGLSLSARSERLDLTQLLAATRRLTGAVPAALALSGSGAFALAARPVGDRYELDGRIDLDAARVAYGTWFAKPEGVPGSAAFTGALSRDQVRTPREATIQRHARQVGLSAVRVRLHTVEATGRAMVVLGGRSLVPFYERIAARGELDTGDTPLDGWERLVPVLGGGALSGRARLRVSWALDGAHPPAYTASIRLTDARAAVRGWAKPIEGVTGTVALERGVVVLKSVTARMDDGAVTLRGRIDPFAPKPAFDLDVGVDRVQAADVLARFTSLKDFLSGRLTGRMTLAGSGTRWEDLAPTLTGRGELAVTEGVFRTFNLLKDVLGSVEALETSRLAERPDTPFDRFAVSVEIRDQAVRMTDARLSAGEFGATADGVVGFDSSIDARVRVSVPRSSVGGFATTALGAALAGDDGRLHVPVRLSGRLPKPAVALDRTAALDEAKQRLRKRASETLREFLDQPESGGKASPRDLLKGLLKREGGR
jgi:AsmA protein